MSLSSSFAHALSGLRVNSRLTEIASNNLANALTDGYGRQRVDVSARTLSGEGAGARVTTVLRASSPTFTAARRAADGEASFYGTQAEAMQRLANSLGEATDSTGLFRRLETFETELRQFAETPESAPRQVQVAEAARDVAQSLQTLSQEAAIVRQNADAAIAADVATVNSNLYSIFPKGRVDFRWIKDWKVPMGCLDNEDKAAYNAWFDDEEAKKFTTQETDDDEMMTFAPHHGCETP